jgi:hypothetical protein
MNFNLNLGSAQRKHLKPIPVSTTVCPYVRLMHVAANEFQALSPAQDLTPYFDDNPTHWPKLRADVAHRLDVLDHAVLVGEGAQFPRLIERRLATVVADIHAGEVQLVRAHDSFDLVMNSQPDLTDGQDAFGDASDLVGNACGVHLAADPLPSYGS